MLETVVNRKPLKDEVFDVLHSRIIAGEYAAGSWLRQEEISSHLGVSMTPVREALDLLVSTGLAERVPYRGVRVLAPSSREILNSYGLRLLLEPTATYAAAVNASAEQVLQLRAILAESKELVTLDDMSRLRVLSRELHGGLVAASGNPLLHRSYVTALNTFPDWMLFEYLFRHPEILAESMREEYEEHAGIVEAVAGHNPALAAGCTIDHILNRGKELHTYLGIAYEEIRAAEDQVLPLLSKTIFPKHLFEEEST